MDTPFKDFSRSIDSLVTELEIPSVSACIIRGDSMVWSEVFGDKQALPDDNSVYHLASLTKTFTSVLFTRFAEKGKTSMEEPAKNYGLRLDKAVKIRHLLSHTSEGTPGSYFNYNSRRFSMMRTILEKSGGKSFSDLIYEEIIKVAGMKNTAPNPLDEDENKNKLYDFEKIRGIMAAPYEIRNGRAVKGTYPEGFSPGAGLVSNISDLVRYVVSIRNGDLVPGAYSNVCFSPVTANNGDTLPYGLGWFVQYINGNKVIWHYGDWKCNSSLLMIVPDADYAFIILANTDGLSAPFYGLSVQGDITYSPFAHIFLDFITENTNTSLTHPGQKTRKIIANGEIFTETGRKQEADSVFKSLYRETPLQFKKYTGVYRSGKNSVIISAKDDVTMEARISIEGKKPFQAGIYPENDRLFYINDFYKIEFSEENTKFHSLLLMKYGRDVELKR